jgi:hypothetical protein
MKQSYDRWLEMPLASGPLDSVTLVAFPDSSVVVVVAAAQGCFIKVTFAHTHAVSTHDETTHWLADQPETSLPQLSSKGAYPYLVVNNSDWAATFTDMRREMRDEPPKHYLIITPNNYADILSYAIPAIEELEGETWENLFGRFMP